MRLILCGWVRHKEGHAWCQDRLRTRGFLEGEQRLSGRVSSTGRLLRHLWDRPPGIVLHSRCTARVTSRRADWARLADGGVQTTVATLSPALIRLRCPPVSQLIASWLWAVLGLLGRAGRAADSLRVSASAALQQPNRVGRTVLEVQIQQLSGQLDRQQHRCQPQVPNS